jgi:four helix bundle protein
LIKAQIKNFKDLIVWQKGMDLVESIYQLTSDFPAEERYGLASQMRRAAISIPANISEGYARSSRKEYAQFVSIAYGSASELETFLILCGRLKFIDASKLIEIIALLSEILRMLNRLRNTLRLPSAP